MTSQYNNNQKPNNGDDTAYAIGAVTLVGCAMWYEKGAQIRFWLYQNLMTLTLYGFMVLAAFIAFVIYRIKQKNQEELARIRAMQSVRPTHRPRNYYERNR